MPTTCLIDFSLNDRARSINPFVERIGSISGLPAAERLIIDLEKCQYIGPDGAALLGAVILDFRRKHKALDVILPKGPPQLVAFVRHCGLEALVLGHDVPEMDSDGEEQPVMPLKQMHRATFQAPDPIIEMVRRYGSFDQDVDESLRVCINEVIQNIQDHASSPIGGILTARYMTKDNEVRVAIVDRGSGICTTLRQRWPDTNADNVLPRVLFEGSYSAQSRENNQGLGLVLLVSIIERLKGSLFVLSESSAAEIRRNGKNWIGRLTARFEGTGVFFTLPVGE